MTFTRLLGLFTVIILLSACADNSQPDSPGPNGNGGYQMPQPYPPRPNGNGGYQQMPPPYATPNTWQGQGPVQTLPPPPPVTYAPPPPPPGYPTALPPQNASFFEGVRSPMSQQPLFPGQAAQIEANWLYTNRIDFNRYRETLLYFQSARHHDGRLMFPGHQSVVMTREIFRHRHDFSINDFRARHTHYMHRGLHGYRGVNTALYQTIGVRVDIQRRINHYH